MSISQKLIAKKAGVSCSTVSRAFTKNARIHPETLAKIQAAMKELGIEDPNAVLSSPPPVRQVLIIVPDISDAFHADTIKGISDKLYKSGMIASLCNSNHDDFQITETYLNYAEANHFAGVIMLSVVASPPLIELLKHYSIPVILVNRFIRTLDMDVVCIDNYRGGYMAARCLIENGHEKIAFLAGNRLSTAHQDRLRGFSDAMADAGIPFTPDQIYYGADNTRSSGRDFVNHFFTPGNPYTALFASSNPTAIGALTQLLELGYSVPDDVSIICFDDTPLVNDGKIKLTTVGYEPYLIGSAAVDSLLSRIDKPFAEKIKVTYSPHLTMRDSIRKLS